MDDNSLFFTQPTTPLQKQYEAVRAIIVDKQSHPLVAKQFNYSVNTLYTMLRDFRSGKLQLFPSAPSYGPKERRTPEPVREAIITYRKQQMSCKDIAEKLRAEGYKISKRTIENILHDADFSRLPRRAASERGETQKNEFLPERASALDFETLEPFAFDCPVVGIYFFITYIIESGILDIVKQCKLPESSVISHEQACLSMLLLKLIGNKRLSHMASYDHEKGLGLFAGLTVLPKSTYMSTYSCRTDEAMLSEFQQQLVGHFQKIYPEFYQSEFINLDFHSIPHFGEESQMEKVWCGARGKAMKGANTLFAQDAASNVILYTKADILRKNETSEIVKFANYWKQIRQDITETLVFDCKLTSYQVLDTLVDDNIKFITLRKRNKALLAETCQIAEENWKKLFLPIPKRKHKKCSVYESDVILPKCKNPFRQIIVKDHGRAEPTFIITSNRELSLKDVLIVYAKRWHIENKFAELVSFFNLNALSSPIMIRIHFDMLWTIIADTLYHRFMHDLPRYEYVKADHIFRKFIDMPGRVIFDGADIVVKIRKRSTTPILRGVEKLKKGINVPWLDNRLLRFEWTA
jgi:transposase